MDLINRLIVSNVSFVAASNSSNFPSSRVNSFFFGVTLSLSWIKWLLSCIKSFSSLANFVSASKDPTVGSPKLAYLFWSVISGENQELWPPTNPSRRTAHLIIYFLPYVVIFFFSVKIEAQEDIYSQTIVLRHGGPLWRFWVTCFDVSLTCPSRGRFCSISVGLSVGLSIGVRSRFAPKFAVLAWIWIRSWKERSIGFLVAVPVLCKKLTGLVLKMKFKSASI